MRKPDLLWKNDIEINKIITITNTLGHRMGILGCSTSEMKMSLGC